MTLAEAEGQGDHYIPPLDIVLPQERFNLNVIRDQALVAAESLTATAHLLRKYSDKGEGNTFESYSQRKSDLEYDLRYQSGLTTVKASKIFMVAEGRQEHQFTITTT